MIHETSHRHKPDKKNNESNIEENEKDTEHLSGEEFNRRKKSIGRRSVFGSPDDWRRIIWVILIKIYESEDEGADWNDVLDEAEQRGIDREWTHNELIYRLRCGDAHLHQGNLYPHYKQHDHSNLLYHISAADKDTPGFSTLKTSLTEKECLEHSLWRVVVQKCGQRGAKEAHLIRAAEKYGMDWMWAHEMLQVWLKCGNLEKSGSGGRVTPTREEWVA